VAAVAGISTVFVGSVATGLLRMAGLKRFESTRAQMGTRVAVAVWHPDAEEARSLVGSAFEEMERLEGILSHHRPGTALDRLNKEGYLRNAPPEIMHLLEKARALSEMSGGAFDVTVAPLLQLYERAASHSGPLPSDVELARARSVIDYREVHLSGRDISLGRVGMAVTLDSMAKGFIVDRAMEVLLAGGADQVMVDAGGDVASGGSTASTDGWRIALQDPRDPGGVLGVVLLTGQAVATSGDYAQTLGDDLTLHHILDPRTGRSPEHTSAVTVIAPTAMEADALSTTAFVLGPSEGRALLERLPTVEGLIVTKGQEIVTTSDFGRYTV
jgi:thiamine biosynthesis lipoprotein